MLVLFKVLTIISVLLLIIGLISPRMVVRFGRHRTRGRAATLYGVTTAVCAIVLFFTWVHAANSSNAPANWNTSDIHAASNGNISLAAQWIEATPNSTKSSAISAQPSVVLKKPWEYYGQALRLTGTVTAVAPADSQVSKELGGTASKITMVSKDGTYVEFLMAGNSNQVKTGDAVSIYGYPVGQDSVATKSGSNTTGLAIVGNVLDDPAS